MSTKVLALNVAKKFQVIRGFRIILDRDVAELYGTETKILNTAVRRKKGLFTKDLMWQLTPEEMLMVEKRLPNIKPDRGGRPHLPFAFTELGILMVASVLRSQRALEVNVSIITALAETRPRKEDLLHGKVREQVESLQTSLNSLSATVSLNTSPNQDQSHFSTIEKPPRGPYQNPSPKKLVETVAKYFEIPLRDLQGSSRKQKIVVARHLAMYVVRKRAGLPLREVGYIFEKKDHTTIIHACEKIEKGLQANGVLRRQLRDIEDAIKSEDSP